MTQRNMFVLTIWRAMKNFMRFFFPEEIDFYSPMEMMFELIESSVDIYLDAAKKETLTQTDKATLCLMLKQNELKGDEIVMQADADLKRTFTPPFSHVELRRLFNNLDNALDMLDESAKASVHADYRGGFPPFVKEQLSVYKRGVAETRKLVSHLRNPRRNTKEARKRLKRISDIETEGDKIYWPAKKELSIYINDAARNNRLYDYRRGVMDEMTLDKMEEIIDTLVGTIKVIEGMLIEHA
ncbi:hypothetical protein MNBD_NITROSPINAE02-1279 [hydrothermal vent metagenome]|uniref:Uncharacterized protein n=1 Tax=hydrothermal vent metagenome TaxID=652676 RepID=A0A3B1BMX2_9ZZZZ